MVFTSTNARSSVYGCSGSLASLMGASASFGLAHCITVRALCCQKNSFWYCSQLLIVTSLLSDFRLWFVSLVCMHACGRISACDEEGEYRLWQALQNAVILCVFTHPFDALAVPSMGIYRRHHHETSPACYGLQHIMKPQLLHLHIYTVLR